MKNNIQGFTLIEIMIVVSILGILSAIALPSYQGYMQDGRRAEVQHYALQQIAILERQYTRLGGYPAVFAPTNDFYTFTYESEATPGVATVGNNGTSFLLKFKPQTGSAQQADKCGEMTIDHQGTAESLVSNMTDDCWD